MVIRILMAFVLLWWGGAALAGAAPMALHDAVATVTVGGSTTQSAVTLPYGWDERHRGQQGSATFDVAFSLPRIPAEPYVVYFVRLGNAYEVWLNGVLLERNGDLDRFDGADYAQVPRLMAIPARLLQKNNLFRIHIKADIGRRAGVPELLVGPDDELQARYRNEYRWQVTGSLVVAILSLLMGTFAIALWLTQTDPAQPQRFKRDDLYLFAGLAEFCWALRVGAVLIEQPPLPWPWWAALNVMALGGWVGFMVVFCLSVAGWLRHRWARWLTRVLWVLLATAGLAVLAAKTWQLPWLVTLWYGLFAAVAVPFSLFYCWRAVRRPTTMRLLVAAALLFNALVGLRDWVVFRFSESFGGKILARYSSVLLGLTLGYIVISRFRAARIQARDLLATLASRVAQKEFELQQSYARVEQLARQQERTAERARILRDMHDGVGSHISAAIRQLQSGKASQAELLQTLRDSLDQLKLSIDSMNLPPGDITALLANLRYRLEPRFAVLDIELQWGVDLLEPMEGLDANAMRQLQFMVFEALSNVLQHAQANVLRIEARMQGMSVQLRIVDNGRGFDTRTRPRKGLLSMQERAAAIGAALTLQSRPGQTVVEILLAAGGSPGAG